MREFVKGTSEPLRWHWRLLLAAPHRLGFFSAMVVLVACSTWWALVQLQRAGVPLPLNYAVSPTLTHAAVMSFGFMPLFFAGFLFTAGPRWLGVLPPSARELLPFVAAQAAGWLLWLFGAHTHLALALAGLVLSLLGLAGIALRFWRLILASPVEDRMHAKSVGTALVFGCVCIAGLGSALLAGSYSIARAFVLSGLWGCIVVVFTTVSHRMIPFFTSGALPLLKTLSDDWVLGLMLGTAGFEALAVWFETFLGTPPMWQPLRGAVELFCGSVLLWLALAWGLVQSLKIRLLAMLHVGFVWLGLGLAGAGLMRLLADPGQTPGLTLAMQHAINMGSLGSLMMAMVTRVSCGHSGRALVADDLVWGLFWLLQLAVLLRIAGAVEPLPMQALFATAALLWAAVMAIWAIRYGSWYGRPRIDGKPG